jgi:hypothetical protein
MKIERHPKEKVKYTDDSLNGCSFAIEDGLLPLLESTCLTCQRGIVKPSDPSTENNNYSNFGMRIYPSF